MARAPASEAPNAGCPSFLSSKCGARAKTLGVGQRQGARCRLSQSPRLWVFLSDVLVCTTSDRFDGCLNRSSCGRR
jgi:hypothetical protein